MTCKLHSNNLFFFFNDFPPPFWFVAPYPKLLLPSRLNARHIDSSKPHRMKNHMKHIILFGRSIYLKMSLNLYHPSLHSQILISLHILQHPLQFQYLLRSNMQRKLTPIKNIRKWQLIVISNNHRNTTSIYSFHNSRTCHLISTRTQAEFTSLH